MIHNITNVLSLILSDRYRMEVNVIVKEGQRGALEHSPACSDHTEGGDG